MRTGSTGIRQNCLPLRLWFGNAAAVPDTTEAYLDLFQALQQQAGLKLDAEKTAVDVIAVDHVEKPSAS
jgi:uncharacterized protein (TIGR03435 family)